MTTASPTPVTAGGAVYTAVGHDRRRARINPWVVGGLAVYAIAGLIGIIALIVPSLSHLMTDQDLSATFKPPLTPGHPLGTDSLGRDLMWRILGGLGVSICVGLGVAVISIVLGLVLGVFGGFFGRAAAVGTALVVDVTWAFPAILLAIVFAGWLGPGLPAVILALALTGWASFAVIVRGEMLSLRERDFVSAARVLGVSRIRISLTHLLISLFPVTVVMSVFFVSTSIVAESGLSFLGLGAQPPMPSLGVILAEGRDYLSRSWWPVVFAGGALTVLVLLMNALADNLRDRFDPRNRSSR
ncbi:MAG TPA: ABC transporter permease [Rhodoglobus sp.]|nr:ABC transporter permease [Rhodoglobus sp.]